METLTYFKQLKQQHPEAVILFRMAGFPHHALDTYLPRLVRFGNRVAIVDK